MTEPEERLEDEHPPGLEWVVSCPHHGARAHLYIEGLDKTRPDLQHCSLEPGQFPPSCNQACMGSLVVQGPGGEAQEDPDDLEETQAD